MKPVILLGKAGAELSKNVYKMTTLTEFPERIYGILSKTFDPNQASAHEWWQSRERIKGGSVTGIPGNRTLFCAEKKALFAD